MIRCRLGRREVVRSPHAQLRASINLAVATYNASGRTPADLDAFKASLAAARSVFAHDAAVVAARAARHTAIHNAWVTYAASVRAARVAFHSATGHWPHATRIVRMGVAHGGHRMAVDVPHGAERAVACVEQRGERVVVRPPIARHAALQVVDRDDRNGGRRSDGQRDGQEVEHRALQPGRGMQVHGQRHRIQRNTHHRDNRGGPEDAAQRVLAYLARADFGKDAVGDVRG